ncbi:amino acid ABC transporter permease [Hwanghaeella grinnelliae]|uniref:Amino acid ABC transporter permease n=1 Tax=Hwanghaeella grinnelliae TaxID=2500179 RepID=A0A437QQF1_9PROT|nr:amino acid ABC transporter permease [Hwanghaeella grinnelliae]RVU36735.1 amino acid ABC transporter permease [Hwanghaeella grinnelliae]
MVRGSKKPRFGILDVIVLAAAIAAVAYVTYRVDSVLVYTWDWSAIPGYLFRYDEDLGHWVPNLLIKGLITTIRISIWALIVASIMGTILGVMRTSQRLLPRLIGWAYVEFIRNIPPVPFLFLFYFFISSQIIPLLNIGSALDQASPATLGVVEFLFGPANLIENFLSGLISLSMMSAAYIAEIVRAGILAVPKGQYEAGSSIGLSKLAIMRYIVLPQAIQRVVPPIAGQFITLIKDSSLVALISIQELSFLAMEIAISEQRFFEVWLFTGLMYFTICYACALAFGRLEKRMGRHLR